MVKGTSRLSKNINNKKLSTDSYLCPSSNPILIKEPLGMKIIQDPEQSYLTENIKYQPNVSIIFTQNPLSCIFYLVCDISFAKRGDLYKCFQLSCFIFFCQCKVMGGSLQMGNDLECHTTSLPTNYVLKCHGACPFLERLSTHPTLHLFNNYAKYAMHS